MLHGRQRWNEISMIVTFLDPKFIARIDILSIDQKLWALWSVNKIYMYREAQMVITDVTILLEIVN